MDYNEKCSALEKQLLLNKCVLMQKVVLGKAPQYDLLIPSEHLHFHGNKQLLSRTTIDIFKTSFSFSGSLAWNSLTHHLRYPMQVKTLILSFFSFTRHLDTKCVFPLANSCQVLHLYFTQKSTFNICIFARYCTLFHFPCGHHFNALYILFRRFPLFA